jgi:hypothetical protein
LQNSMTELNPLNHPSGDGFPDNGRSSHRRAVILGLGISSVFHFILIIIYSFGLNQWDSRENILQVESSSKPFSGMRVVNVIEIDPDDAISDALREELTDELDVMVKESELVAGPTEDNFYNKEDVKRIIKAVDALRVRSSDPRLWRAALPQIFELTEAERLRLELAGRLEAWNDSVSAAVAVETAWTDWTMTDGDGNRWGVSPGKLHLGKLTLPLPFRFAGTSWQRERAARKAWEDTDILNNISAQAVRASWEKRAKAIRERKDREHKDADQKSDTTLNSGDRLNF